MYRVQGSSVEVVGYSVKDKECRVWGSGLDPRVKGVGSGVQGLGCKV